jgi:hypothetical protein
MSASAKLKAWCVLVVGIIVTIGTTEAFADRVVKRVCTTDAYGTRTCTEYFASGAAKRPHTDRIMGMPAKTYERGLKRGRCMPSPSGACGGG